MAPTGTGKRTPEQQRKRDEYLKDRKERDAAEAYKETQYQKDRREKREAYEAQFMKDNNIKTSGRSTSLNWAKAITQILAGDEAALTSALKGDSDQLLLNAEGMSDVEFASSVLFLIAMSAGGKVGEKAGRRTATKSGVLEANKKASTFKSPKKLPQDVIEAQVDAFNKLTREQQTKALDRATEKEYQKANAEFKKNPSADNQKKVDETGATFSEYRREMNETDAKVKADATYKAKVERDAEVLRLQSETSDVRDEADFRAAYRFKNRRNPTTQELYDFKIAELERVKSGVAPPSLIDMWYEEYGSGVDGVDSELQLLGRRVMQGLDPDGDATISEPGIFGNYINSIDMTPTERSAIMDAYNNKSIWESLKNDYRTYVAGASAAAAVATGVTAADDTGGDGEQKGDDLEDAADAFGDGDGDGMDLDEEVDDRPKFVRDGTETDEETVTRLANEAKAAEEAAYDAEIEAAEIARLEAEDAAKAAQQAGDELAAQKAAADALAAQKTADELAAQQEKERKEYERIERDEAVALLEEGDAGGEGIAGGIADSIGEAQESPVIDITDINDLIEETMTMSQMVYEIDKFPPKDYVFNFENDIPVLFHAYNDTLVVSFRGSKSVVDWVRNLNPGSFSSLDQRTKEDMETNAVYHFATLVDRIPQREATMQFFEGFLEGVSKLYDNIRTEIDTYNNGVQRKLIFTGHSQGAAVCSIFMYLYIMDTYNTEQKFTNIRAITYASPRFVVEGYEQLFNEVCPELIRVFNVNDPIPYLPLRRALFMPIPIISGFIHVGRPLCLNAAVASNNINRLVTENLKKSKEAITHYIMKEKGETIETNRLLSFILSPKYLASMLGASVECMGNVALKRDVTTEELNYVLKQLDSNYENIRTYDELCEMGRVYGVADYLKANPIEGESPEQQPYNVIVQIIGAMLMNHSISEEHMLPAYKKLFDQLRTSEILKGEDIYEAAADFDDTFTTGLTMSNMDVIRAAVEEMETDALGIVDIQAYTIGQIYRFPE